jgi:hypothetical protein
VVTRLDRLQLPADKVVSQSAIRAQLTEIGGPENWISKIVKATKIVNAPKHPKTTIPPATAGEIELEDNLPSTGEEIRRKLTGSGDRA